MIGHYHVQKSSFALETVYQLKISDFFLGCLNTQIDPCYSINSNSPTPFSAIDFHITTFFTIMYQDGSQMFLIHFRIEFSRNYTSSIRTPDVKFAFVTPNKIPTAY